MLDSIMHFDRFFCHYVTFTRTTKSLENRALSNVGFRVLENNACSNICRLKVFSRKQAVFFLEKTAFSNSCQAVLSSKTGFFRKMKHFKCLKLHAFLSKTRIPSKLMHFHNFVAWGFLKSTTSWNKSDFDRLVHVISF